jgi:Dolichyl-phosphate-mannose-protein mannosyltransferase
MNYRRLSQLADQLSARSASLFTVTPPSGQRPKWTTLVLVVLVLIAAVVRFWGVGSFSLHKPDEDTTALAAVHILEDGTPRFPSGMFYARAIAQSYMIAASAEVFGQTEWALRLPSVLCGVLAVVLAYWMGRRFLSPVWNLAFAACVAFLPGLIADSQEARMYIFMIASLACYAGLVFEWERTGKRSFLVAAVAVMLLGIQFHELVIFGALVVLLPGLLRGDGSRLLQGTVALAIVGLGYILISRWTASFYPPVAADYGAAVPQLGQAPPSMQIGVRALFGAVAVVAGAGLAWFLTSRMKPGSPRAAVRALVWLGLVSQAALYYHIGALLFLIALILAKRSGALARRHVASLFLACALLALLHVIILHAAGVSSPRKLVGILIGRPTIWQYLMLGSYSPVAATVTLLGLAHAGWQLANRRPLADHWLYFLLAAGLPLFALGLFGWYFPARYVEFALLPFLVTAFACCQQWMLAYRIAGGEARWAKPVIAAAASAIFVGPAAARAVNAGYTFADHRAAAQFMRSIARGPKDIVIAEEVLMQTYYLGHVDYWLQDPSFAARFVIRRNGSFVDEYTNTPVIGTSAALEALLEKSDRGAIYVIGSGENFDGGQRPMRPAGVDQLLHSNSFMPLFVARDGLTTVWKAAVPVDGPIAN